MEKRLVKWQKQMTAVNEMLKTRGFKIVNLHGARSTGFYPAQASKGLQYIMDNFEQVVNFLEKHPTGICIKNACCFQTMTLDQIQKLKDAANI